jgi:hypothetical protein
MDFVEFKKIPRLSREMIITEKIDGTNAQIVIVKSETIPLEERWKTEKIVGDYIIRACSRNRWIQPENDNMGFAKWVHTNAEQLIQLGEGRHFGEWWGQGIQRNYGLKEKRFSLFNVSKWAKKHEPLIEGKSYCPDCCEVVPELYVGEFDTKIINDYIIHLKINGSHAVPGFMNPEGIVIFHTAAGQYFKKTLENDEQPKSKI